MSGHLVLEAFFGSSLLGVHNFVGWMAILATILNSQCRSQFSLW